MKTDTNSTLKSKTNIKMTTCKYDQIAHLYYHEDSHLVHDGNKQLINV